MAELHWSFKCGVAPVFVGGHQHGATRWICWGEGCKVTTRIAWCFCWGNWGEFVSLKQKGSFSWVKVWCFWCFTMLMVMFANFWWGFSRLNVTLEWVLAEKGWMIHSGASQKSRLMTHNYYHSYRYHCCQDMTSETLFWDSLPSWW